jgi:hypothetical protein
MSASAEPPERLAEILLEILALSKPARTNPSESEAGNLPIEMLPAHCLGNKSQCSDGADGDGECRGAGPHLSDCVK